MKKYNTLEELLKEITSTRRFDIDTEAAIQYQDLIGHSNLQELGQLANGDYKEMFFNIYQVAYGTIEAIKFWAKHSNYCIDLRYEKDEATARKEIAEAELKARTDDYNTISGLLTNANKAIEEMHEVQKAAQIELDAQRAEIVALKAKLYDLMTK